MRIVFSSFLLFIYILAEGQSYSSKIFETDNLKFEVTADCKILPFEDQFLKDNNSEPLVDQLSLAISGTDPNGNWSLAISAPYFDTTRIYKPGFSLGFSNYIELDKVFDISGLEILSHIEDFEDNGVIDNPNSKIFSWPSRGNKFFIEYFDEIDLIDASYELAPFHDKNQNGIYEPDKGEFPMYELGVLFEKSVLPVHLFWTSVLSEFHTSVGLSVYSLECGEDSNRDYTFFTHYEVKNEAIEDMNCAGVSTRNKLASSDLFMSTVPSEDAYILMDSRQEFFGAYIQSHVMTGPIGGIIERDCSSNLDTVIWSSKFNNVIATYDSDLPNQQLDAQSTVREYWYVLSGGLWPDRTPLTKGGVGYNPLSKDSTYFIFQGDLRDTSHWNEYNNSEFSDKKESIYSTTFAPVILNDGPPISRTIAHTFLPMTSRTTVYNEIYSLRRFFFDFIWNSERGAFSDLCQNTVQADDVALSELRLFPNPASEKLDISLEVFKVTVFDFAGQEKLSAFNTRSVDLSTLMQGVYFLQIEFNGKLAIKKVIKI